MDVAEEMKIPTPILIKELKKPIDISLWDTISLQEYKRLCTLAADYCAALGKEELA